MSYLFRYPFPVLIKTILLVLILNAAIREAKSVDPKFEACRPRNCGKGPNISYPFWIPLTQKSYCGLPGFEITCFDDGPGLLTSDIDQIYLIRDISYATNSLLVANDVALQDDCHVPLNNFSLEGTPFSFDRTSVNFLFFFYNCTRSIPLEFQNFSVTCASKVPGTYSFALFENDLQSPYLNSSLETCKSTVGTPVDMNNLSFGMSYSDLLTSGFPLNWTQNDNCSVCEASGGRCGIYQNEIGCFCPSGFNRQSCTAVTADVPVAVAGRKINKAMVITAVIVSSSIFAITFVAILVWSLRRKLSSAGNTKTVQAFLRDYGSLAPRRFSYSDVKKMTNSFKEKLGQGGFGGVFKGKLPNGRLVAVKVLNHSKGNGEEFINEVASISRTSHVNIVTLLGFCFDGSKRALIYEFMSNGSLDKFIYNKQSMNTYPHLGWERLHQIAVGIAKGLEYLHRGCNTRILHFDIKPHNILLDEDFCPKISDFGLAKLCPKKDSIISMADARGTIGYIAPEVFSRNFGGVSHKSDVYSYGMMVLEMVGGRKNFDAGVDHTSESYFPDWIYKHIGHGEHLQLSMIMREKEEEIARQMVLVGLWCIQMDPANRPSISRVVEMLEGNLESLPIPPKPYFSSPPRQPADFFTRSVF